MNTTKDKVARYVIVNEGSGRIVATTPGTHKIMEAVIDRLQERHGGTYFYDDATEASKHLPQIGPNVALSVGGHIATPSRVRMDMW